MTEPQAMFPEAGIRKRRKPKPSRSANPPPANACAARSPSRSTCRRAGPGMIIRRRAVARMARPMRPMSEAGASAFASPRARPASRATRTRRPRPRAASASSCGTPISYERARSPHMVNIPRALFSGRTGRQPLYHIAIEELQEWAYTGEPLVPLKGFPGVVWQRSKKKKRGWIATGDDRADVPRRHGRPRRAAMTCAPLRCVASSLVMLPPSRG